MLGTVRRALRRRRLKLARAAGELRDRLRHPSKPVVELESVRRRLELLVAGLHSRTIPIAASEDRVLATTDGEGIALPRRLDATAGSAAAIARYQLLALEQAERIARGSAISLSGLSPLERDLYLVAEGHVVDACVAERMPRLAPVLRAAREAELASRPRLDGMRPLARAVEMLARRALGSDVPGEPVPTSATPAESLAWARATAARLAPGIDDWGRYRPLRSVAHWGEPLPAATKEANEQRPEQSLENRHAPRMRVKQSDDASPDALQQDTGISRTRLKDERRMRADSRGLVTIRASGESDAQGDRGSSDATAAPFRDATTIPAAATWYHEWDCYARRYRTPGAAVVEPEPVLADGDWATRTLGKHAALVREVKHRFGRLRAQRARLHHQRGGDELDLAAVVAAVADLRSGHAPDDRLYLDVRPARRGLAIALLVDISGSTDAPVTDTQQIIDVEKEAMLFASEALDELGDRYAVLAFSGRGAEQVRMTTVKSFAETDGELVRRRMAGLAPDANTRLGAAVRHAAALLAREPAGHRLLLLLSDGKPNDVGHYQGEYAVEDSRQAILEARAMGIYPFCLAVDREEPEYLARIFGESGHTILRSPAQLPTALLGAVRKLLAS